MSPVEAKAKNRPKLDLNKNGVGAPKAIPEKLVFSPTASSFVIN